uniref:Serine/threonine-protein kinase 1 n=1 Tax=Elaeophora elaphi TaxID=1147741 RepID=A0A0R3RME4_9BILA
MERPQQCLDLFDLISIYGYLDEDIARSIFAQILNTTCLLYSTYGIIHRDIKDENIIINMLTGEAILVDFGAAALISEACIKEFQGTRSYCPPEWFKRLACNPLEATVWSLGIVLYVMISGCLPFQNEIQICLGRFTIPKHISKDCENLLRQCLAVTPSRRPDLLDIFKHRWLHEPILVYSESFQIVLQRHFQRRKEAQGKNNLKQNGKIQEKGKKSTSTVNKNEFTTMKNSTRSSDISIGDNRSIRPLQSHDNTVFNSELLKKHRHHSSYDNLVMSARSDISIRRECTEADSSVLMMQPSSIAEGSEYSDSLFCSACESFSMISTDPQNSESYFTALDDNNACFFQRSKEATTIESFNNNSRTQTLSSLCDNCANYEKERAAQANCSDKPSDDVSQQKVMNSRLVAKHWLRNIAMRSKYGSLKLQRPSNRENEKDQPAQKHGTVSSNLLRIFNMESRRSSTQTIVL